MKTGSSSSTTRYLQYRATNRQPRLVTWSCNGPLSLNSILNHAIIVQPSFQSQLREMCKVLWLQHFAELRDKRCMHVRNDMKLQHVGHQTALHDFLDQPVSFPLLWFGSLVCVCSHDSAAKCRYIRSWYRAPYLPSNNKVYCYCSKTSRQARTRGYCQTPGK